MKLSQNEATRIVNIIDGRIKRALGRGTVVEVTYGDVDSVSERYANVLLGGDTNVSNGFRIPSGMDVVAGDRVRVIIDPRGDRYLAEVIHPTTYPKATVDPVRGSVTFGTGSSAPDTILSLGAIGLDITGGSGGLTVAGDIDVAGAATFGSFTAGSLTSTGNLDVDGDATLVGTTTTTGVLHADGGIEMATTSAIAWVDAILSRESAFTLMVDGHFVVDNNLYLGSAKDTFLYRNGVGVVKTDGVLEVAGFHRGGGTSFPANPAASDRYFRTDIGMEFYYDGTRWLSTQLFPGIPGLHRGQGVVPLTASLSANQWVDVSDLHGGSDLWVEEVSYAFLVETGGTALGASHKWVITVVKVVDGARTETTIATLNIDSGASNAARKAAATINALLNSGTVHDAVYFHITKTGTPGALYFAPTVWYRVVAT